MSNFANKITLLKSVGLINTQNGFITDDTPKVMNYSNYSLWVGLHVMCVRYSLLGLSYGRTYDFLVQRDIEL